MNVSKKPFAERVVGKTQISPTCRVSTMLIYENDDGDIYETVVFGGEHSYDGEQYATRAAARLGHDLFVAFVRGEITKDVLDACLIDLRRQARQPAPECWCRRCEDLRLAQLQPGVALLHRRFIVCPTCGNKRCPRATFHEHACTGSNEPGQPGSDYA